MDTDKIYIVFFIFYSALLTCNFTLNRKLENNNKVIPFAPHTIIGFFVIFRKLKCASCQDRIRMLAVQVDVENKF